jgi:WD40 repeat protein
MRHDKVRILSLTVGLAQVCCAHTSGREPNASAVVAAGSSATTGVTALAISADDELMATAGADRLIRIWEVATGRLRLTIPSEYKVDFDIGFAARAPRLSASGQDRVWRIWDTASGSLVKTMRMPDGMREYRMGASTADNAYAVLRRGADADVYEATRPVRVLRGHAAEVLAEAIGASGETAVTGSRDSTARIWRVVTGELLQVLQVNDGPVVDVSINEGANMVVTASGRIVRLWDLQTGTMRSELRGHSDELCCVSLTHDGRTVLSGSKDGTVGVWSASDATLVRRISHTNAQGAR